MVSMLADTQFNETWKRNSKALEDSGCTLCFACKLLDSQSTFHIQYQLEKKLELHARK
jgi:hypothetical protein